ncbi:hypothetical protein GF339_03490 [candidate division KSB3 bacterium]|uniref:SxtJ n=1 Tax=candidate division KSB3 bacterium TaxID=2044937 RepID=A0A9D5JTY0_9BACT|nr:hypothetical protein [candidate division KSB3 bacterium]MBD3323621.1 hypothetical protein [candidate division KSB3 bacterium]
MIRDEVVQELQHLDTGEKSLRKFGLTMAVVLGILSLYALHRTSDLFPIVFLLFLIFWLAGITHPIALRKVYVGWMTLALILGFFMTRLILAVMYYVVFTIIGLILRLFNRDMLDQQYDPQAASYWQRRQPPQDIQQHLERQF